MKVTNITNFKLDFSTEGSGGNDIVVVLDPGQFVYTISDEKNRSINLHGARRNIYLEITDLPDGLEYFTPYTEESATHIINQSNEIDVQSPAAQDVQEDGDQTDIPPEEEPMMSGGLQDNLILTEEGKKSVNIEDLVIEKVDPYADINIVEIITEEESPKPKKKSSRKKGPGRPKKRGPKPKKKPPGRPPGAKNKKKKK